MGLDAREVLGSICGTQPESGIPKATVTVTTGIIIEEQSETREVDSYTVFKPVVHVEKHRQYVICDLRFISGFDEDLKRIYKVLEVYGKNLHDNDLSEYDEGAARMPYLAIITTATVGKANMLTMLSPIMWVLTSDKPGVTPNTIRLMFNMEDVLMQEGLEEDLLDQAIEEESDNL